MSGMIAQLPALAHSVKHKPARESKLAKSGHYVTKPTDVQDSVASYVRTRAMAWKTDRAQFAPKSASSLSSVAANRLPETLSETPLSLEGCDKVFASAWINDHMVAVGTKCNRLLLVNVASGKVLELPYSAIVNSAARIAASAPGSPSRITQPTPLAGSSTPYTQQPACVGIHSITLNASRTRLAVGSGKPYEVVIYSLPSLEPEMLCASHTDLVFAAQFASDDVLVTGSRDGAVGVFQLRVTCDTRMVHTACGDLPLITALAMRSEHQGKVRDVKYNPHTQQLCTLGTDATVRVWDAARMSVVAKAHLPYPNETVCLALDTDKGVLSVGSQSHVTLLDVRTGHSGAASGAPMSPLRNGSAGSGRVLHNFTSLDEGWGVRSLAHNAHTLAVGGGMGKLAFYDLRAQSYLPCASTDDFGFAMEQYDEETGETLPVVQEYLQASQPQGLTPSAHGYHSFPLGISSALYTISFNEDKTRIFTAGGPLQLGARGAYCAIW